MLYYLCMCVCVCVWVCVCIRFSCVLSFILHSVAVLQAPLAPLVPRAKTERQARVAMAQSQS